MSSRLIEFDADTATGDVQFPMADHWMAKLALAQIEDASKLLKRGTLGDRRGGLGDISRHTSAQGFIQGEVNDYWDTVMWMWGEEDEDAERPFSLDWCCMVLQQFSGSEFSAGHFRGAAERAGFKPARPRGPRA